MLKICDRVQRDGFSDQKNVTRRGIYAPDARAVVNVVKIRNQGKRRAASWPCEVRPKKRRTRPLLFSAVIPGSHWQKRISVGGRTRARTWNPLIKRRPFVFQGNLARADLTRMQMNCRGSQLTTASSNTQLEISMHLGECSGSLQVRRTC